MIIHYPIFMLHYPNDKNRTTSVLMILALTQVYGWLLLINSVGSLRRRT